jgi:L-arabinose isomerase
MGGLMSSQDSWDRMASPSKEYPHGSTLMPLEYASIKDRVHKGAKILTGHWQEDGYQDKVFKYNQLCRQMLEFELENNLISI